MTANINLNQLRQQSFDFDIDYLGRLPFSVTGFSWGGKSAGLAKVPTPTQEISLPGDRLIFDIIRVTYIVDEYMLNFDKIEYDWMLPLHFPESTEQFKNFRKDERDQFVGNYAKDYLSDGTLYINNPTTNRVIKKYKFKNLFPLMHDTVDFETGSNESVKAMVGFSYTGYTVEYTTEGQDLVNKALGK